MSRTLSSKNPSSKCSPIPDCHQLTYPKLSRSSGIPSNSFDSLQNSFRYILRTGAAQPWRSGGFTHSLGWLWQCRQEKPSLQPYAADPVHHDWWQPRVSPLLLGDACPYIPAHQRTCVGRVCNSGPRLHQAGSSTRYMWSAHHGAGLGRCSQ